MTDNDKITLTDIESEASTKGDKGSGRRLYEKSMEKYTVRLDDKHLKILDKLVKEKGFNSKSEAIRYLIEQSWIK